MACVYYWCEWLSVVVEWCDNLSKEATGCGRGSYKALSGEFDSPSLDKYGQLIIAYKYMQLISIKCSACNQCFARQLKQYKYQLKVSGENYRPLCSGDVCKKSFRKSKQQVTCQV